MDGLWGGWDLTRIRPGWRNRLEFAAYRAMRSLAAASGPRLLGRLGEWLGLLYRGLGRRRREILRFNLELAFPDLGETRRRDLARRVARHFGRVSLDALRLQRLTPEELRREALVEGESHLREALARDRGVFVLSAHIGSWEVAALMAGLLLPDGLAVVNRPLDNPLLEAELADFRSLFGNHALGKMKIMRAMLPRLKKGGAVGILIDQRTLQHEGVQVPFFAQPAWTHPGLARLSLRLSVPIVPLWGLWEGPGRYLVRFDPPLYPEELEEHEREEVALTARLTGLIEAVIRERPEQWLWYHDRWRDLRHGG